MQCIDDVQVEANSLTAAVFDSLLLLQFKRVDFVQIAQQSKWFAQVSPADKLWPLRLSHRLLTSSHEGIIQLQGLQLCPRGECLCTHWHPSTTESYPMLQTKVIETDLLELPAWQHWTQPCFRVCELKAKLSGAHLLAPERSKPDWGWLYPYTSKSKEGLSCLF